MTTVAELVRFVSVYLLSDISLLIEVFYKM